MRVLMGSLIVVALGSGCADAADDCHNTRSCPPPPDAGTTVIYVTSDAGELCDGVCVPAVVGIGWSSQPFMLWRGSTMQLAATQCPGNAPQSSGQVWYASPDPTPLSCPTCSCAPPTGVCTLAEVVTVSASAACPSDAGVPFDPPSSWDGGCTSNDAISGVACDGGPCLATVGPLTPIESECVPQAVITKVAPWELAAFGCAGRTNNGACNDPGKLCVPALPSPAVGFSICVSRQGDDPMVQCPQGYPARSVYYVDGYDNRECAPCECGPPQGGSCSSIVTVYADDACSVQVGSVTAMSSGPMCVSIPDGSPLGSKQAGPPMYTPGSCQPSGGEQTGSVQPNDPFTFCCQQ
jgi:hypothetical protein